MTGELLTQICLALISIISALITAFVIPYIRSKVSKEKLDQVDYYTKIAVKCAEQIYSQEQWKEKKEYVMEYVRKMCFEVLNINITYDQLDTIVEGIVYSVKKEK